MEIVKTFNFNDKSLTVFGTEDKPLFKAKEICDILKYVNSRDAINKHVENDDKTTVAKRDGGFQTFINESGLYTLIFGSKQHDAKKFKHWVTSDVLPSIRKTGSYEHEYKTPKPMLTYKMESENDLHHKTINFVRQHQETKQLLYTSTLGEQQDSSDKRIDAWKKGYSKGMPDFVLFNPSNKFTGLCIEFKSPKGNGRLSDEQKSITTHFRQLGYKVIISNDYDSIIIKLNDYIRNIRIPCEFCKCKFKCPESRKNHYKFFHKISNVIV